MAEDNNIRTQMRKGLLEYVVLLLMSRSRAYPSDILEALRRADMVVVEGTIYTLLNRLRREGKLHYEWEESPKGPPRKYFSLTPLGAETLASMNSVWDGIANTVSQLRNNTTTNPYEQDI